MNDLQTVIGSLRSGKMAESHYGDHEVIAAVRGLLVRLSKNYSFGDRVRASRRRVPR